jgi:hypothetical protein
MTTHYLALLEVTAKEGSLQEDNIAREVQQVLIAESQSALPAFAVH